VVDAVALFLTVTLAPGTTAPDESNTVPDSVAVTPPCANPRRGVAASPISSKYTTGSMAIRNLIAPPLAFQRVPNLKLVILEIILPIRSLYHILSKQISF
jgi:hypothetical protein